MKARFGYVSNSSSSSFVIMYNDGAKLVHLAYNVVMIERRGVTHIRYGDSFIEQRRKLAAARYHLRFERVNVCGGFKLHGRVQPHALL